LTHEQLIMCWNYFFQPAGLLWLDQFSGTVGLLFSWTILPLVWPRWPEHPRKVLNQSKSDRRKEQCNLQSQLRDCQVSDPWVRNWMKSSFSRSANHQRWFLCSLTVTLMLSNEVTVYLQVPPLTRCENMQSRSYSSQCRCEIKAHHNDSSEAGAHRWKTLVCRQFTGVWKIPARCSGSVQTQLNKIIPSAKHQLFSFYSKCWKFVFLRKIL